MRGRVVVVVLALTASTIAADQQPPSAGCDHAAGCAEAAAGAIAREEFETAHDLAWRAVQLGPRNDAALLYLLARAQSLSGRTHDALVMLQRLAAAGYRNSELAASRDFQHVRSFSDWPRLVSTIAGVPFEPASTPAPAPERSPTPTEVSAPPDTPPTTATPASGANGLPPAMPPPAGTATPDTTIEGLAIPSGVRPPATLARDAVSGRFVVSDGRSEAIKIVDDRTRNAVDLVSRGWAGPYRTSALAIDARRGELWTAGVDESDTAIPRSALHKLQLVSGRLLQTFPIAPTEGPVRLADVAVGSRTVFALDAHGRRVYSVTAGGTSARREIALDAERDPIALAVASASILYVADATGLMRVDLNARTRAAVEAAAGVDLAGLTTIDWTENALFGIQRDSAGNSHAIAIHFDARGMVAKSREVLGPAASAGAAIDGTTFYYVAASPDREGLFIRPVRTR